MPDRGGPPVRGAAGTPLLRVMLRESPAGMTASPSLRVGLTRQARSQPYNLLTS